MLGLHHLKELLDIQKIQRLYQSSARCPLYQYPFRQLQIKPSPHGAYVHTAFHNGMLINIQVSSLVLCLHSVRVTRQVFLKMKFGLEGVSMFLKQCQWQSLNTLASGCFRGFSEKKRLNARVFAREFLLSGMLYRTGKSLKRRGKSSSLHSKNILLLGEWGFLWVTS